MVSVVFCSNLSTIDWLNDIYYSFQGYNVLAIHYPHVRVDCQHLQVPGQELLSGDEGGEIIPESLEARLLPLEGLGPGYPDRGCVVTPVKLVIDPTVNAVQGHVSILQEFIELKMNFCFFIVIGMYTKST